MKVAIGSTNPLKVKAVEKALGFEVLPVKVPSGVSHTPLSIEEMVEGAVRRAKLSFREGVAFAVGIEGGLYKAGDWWLTAFAAVWDGERLGIGHGFGIRMPKAIVERVLAGEELGRVMDSIAGKEGVKHREGAVGVLTRGYLKREEMLVDAVRAAYGDYLRERLTTR